jgi:hypothetical protein
MTLGQHRIQNGYVAFEPPLRKKLFCRETWEDQHDRMAFVDPIASSSVKLNGIAVRFGSCACHF